MALRGWLLVWEGAEWKIEFLSGKKLEFRLVSEFGRISKVGLSKSRWY